MLPRLRTVRPVLIAAVAVAGVMGAASPSSAGPVEDLYRDTVEPVVDPTVATVEQTVDEQTQCDPSNGTWCAFVFRTVENARGDVVEDIQFIRDLPCEELGVLC
jgi:hypothetical protein